MNNKTKTVLITTVLIGGLGMVVHYYPTTPTTPTTPNTTKQSVGNTPKPVTDNSNQLTTEEQINKRFQEGAVMLHAKQYKYAATAFQWVLNRKPNLPEANVNMGFAMLGLGKFKVAHDFFARAIALKATQTNAYYGLAMALEHLQDIQGARGAMRSFIHLSKADNPYLAKARAALWSWESNQTNPTPQTQESKSPG